MHGVRAHGLTDVGRLAHPVHCCSPRFHHKPQTGASTCHQTGRGTPQNYSSLENSDMYTIRQAVLLHIIALFTCDHDTSIKHVAPPSPIIVASSDSNSSLHSLSKSTGKRCECKSLYLRPEVSAIRSGDPIRITKAILCNEIILQIISSPSYKVSNVCEERGEIVNIQKGTSST